MVSLVLRQATPADLLGLVEFYRKAHSDELPATSVRTLEEATDDRRMLVVCDPDGAYVATAATFEFGPRRAVRRVGEFAGTCVTKPYEGYGFQRILISQRLVDYAAKDLPPEGEAASLISVVKAGNELSLGNLRKLGFVDLAKKPDWFAYEELAWYGKPADGGWNYVHATDDAVRQAVAYLRTAGLLDGAEAALIAGKRAAAGAPPPTLRIEVARTEGEGRQLLAIEGGAAARLDAPPDPLVLLPRDAEPFDDVDDF